MWRTYQVVDQDLIYPSLPFLEFWPSPSRDTIPDISPLRTVYQRPHERVLEDISNRKRGKFEGERTSAAKSTTDSAHGSRAPTSSSRHQPMTSTSFARLPSIPTFYSSFGTHRAEIGPRSLGHIISLSKLCPPPAWAPLPSPPMSGSPPPDERTEPQQLAGHRRKRSDTPPTTTAAVAVLQPAPAPAPPLNQGQRPDLYPGLGQGLEGLRANPEAYATTYPTTQPFGYATNVAAIAGPSTATLVHFGPGQISPRATRKTKAHVASACVNCKKKHLRCDNARPCNRCTATGKESTCFDVEHKKRGRPPLKPEDASSRRSYDAALNPLPGPATDSSRRQPQAGSSSYLQPPPTYQRDIRPIQTSGLSDYGRSILRPGLAPHTMYAAPTISPSPAIATGTMSSVGHGHSSDVSSASTQQSTSYFISPPAFSPHGGENVPRSMPQYGSGYPYSQQQGQMMPPHQNPYSYPLFPRTSGHPPDAPVGMYGTSSLQLPPILPAPQGSNEPAMAQQQRQAQHHQQRQIQQEEDDGVRQPDPKRPRMDIKGILGPRND